MKQRFLITQSLLSAWLWSYKTDNGYSEFLSTLKRERLPPNKNMLLGQQFENVLNATLNGATLYPDHEWFRPIFQLAGQLAGAQQQVRLSRDITVQGISFVCYGVLDYLKAGIIYDTKFSKTYHVGKYLDSIQHPMYFFLVPEAKEFQYKISDGTWVYTEKYTPDQVEPIEKTISDFMRFLDQRNLVSTYTELWKSKY